MRNSLHVVFAATESVPVARIGGKRLLLWLVVIALIVALIVAAFVAWKRYSIARSVYQMNDEEIVSLLQKSRHPSSPEGDYKSFTHTMDRSIRCSKCGFNNSASATVCRDCNSPLRNNSYVTSLSRIVY